MKKFISKIAYILPALAMIVGISTMQSACVWHYYQPEVPKSMNKYRG